MHNKMIASVVKTAGAFLYAGVGLGVSKSLIVNFLQTGVPSHAQKPRFKRGINPENMQASRNLRSFGCFSLKGR
jgi:hypothetical protein